MLRARGSIEGAGGGKAIKDAPRPGRPLGWAGVLRQVGHTWARMHRHTHAHTHIHGCLRSMTPCQNIKCMFWLLSQVCVRFFKSIDSGWINGNRGLFFFSLCKKGVRTLCREPRPCRGGKSKLSTRKAFSSSTSGQRALGGRSRCWHELALPQWRCPLPPGGEGFLVGAAK